MGSKAKKISVFGAGSWGTAIAMHLAREEHQVTLWARRPEHAAAMKSTRENADYLPKITFPDGLHVSADLAEATDGLDAVVLAIPTKGLRSFLHRWVPLLEAAGAETQDAHKKKPAPLVPIISATKGIEQGTLMPISQLLRATLPSHLHANIVHLSGPSFAKEVALGYPTVVCVAALDAQAGNRAQGFFHSDRFRVYRSDDEIGVELGGALKNVIALAVGCSDGLGFGANARAGLLTRGLAEITRLAVALGANPLTMAGLSGMGDLVLTCTGDLSRNRTVGYRIGAGESLRDIAASMNQVAEGVFTAKSAHELAQQQAIDMPITTEVYRVLYEDKAPRSAFEDLMQRPIRSELDGDW